MRGVAEGLAAVRRRIDESCRRAFRDPKEVTLLAVSKTFSAAAVAEAREAGQLDFGESRQQEGSAKVATLPGDIRWHFIGRLQRNKVRKVLPDFPVIHSIDSLRLAAHVDRIAGELGLRPEVYVEVNLAGEESKGGLALGTFETSLAELRGLEHLRLAGLMVIPPACGNPEDSRRWFRRARELRDQWLPGAGLSMGMSGDFEVAVEEGSTVVRVGSAIFGTREGVE